MYIRVRIYKVEIYNTNNYTPSNTSGIYKIKIKYYINILYNCVESCVE